jgi:hypothetical protein
MQAEVKMTFEKKMKKMKKKFVSFDIKVLFVNKILKVINTVGAANRDNG